MADGLLARLRAAVDPAPERVAADPPARDAAAVLLLADPAAAGLPLLFIRRTRLVRAHRGQIAFPGGGAEVGDRGPVGTALREAEEEMGVDPAAVEVLGVLDQVITGTTMRRLVPVLAVQRAPMSPVPDAYEVAEWFTVPIADLLVAPVTARRVPGGPDGAVVRFYEVGDRVIWGATAAVLHDLLERLGRQD